jgi:hypothetical protein
VGDRFQANGAGTSPVSRVDPRRLCQEDVEAIAAATAHAVADLVLKRLDGPQANRLVDAVELARVLGVGREWIYENSDRLGVIRLGNGPRPGCASTSTARWRCSKVSRRSGASCRCATARKCQFRDHADHAEGAAYRAKSHLPTAVGGGYSRPVQRQ